MHLLYELSKNAWVRIAFGADFFLKKNWVEMVQLMQVP